MAEQPNTNRGEQASAKPGEQLSTKVVELCWNELKDQMEWQRHNENQRSQLTNYLLIIAVGVLALLPKDRPLEPNDWGYAVVLVGVGVFGVLMVAKYWERFVFHARLAHGYREQVDELTRDLSDELGGHASPAVRGASLAAVWHAGNAEHHRRRWPLLKEPIMLHWFWMALFFVFAVVGVALVVVCRGWW